MARVSVEDPSGRWSSGARLSPEDTEVWTARAAIACDGSAVALFPHAGWSDGVYESRLFARSRRGDGTWQPEVQVDRISGTPDSIELAMSHGGRALAAWQSGWEIWVTAFE